MSNKLSLKGYGTTSNKKKGSRDSNSQNIRAQLIFSSEIALSWKSLISVFQEFSASINKTFILVGSLSTRLSFHGDWKIS